MIETRLVSLMILAHLLGDFVFQGDKIIQMRFPKGLNQIIKNAYNQEVSHKAKSKVIKVKKIIDYTVKGNLLHAVIHSFILCSVIWGNNILGSLRLKYFRNVPLVFDMKLIICVIGGILLIHFLIDQCKVILGFRYPILSKTIWLFVMDQIAHFVSFLLILGLYNGRMSWQVVDTFIANPISLMKADRLIFIAIIFIGITSFAGILIAQIIGHIDYKHAVHNSTLETLNHTEEIRHGGYIIGILERILILCSLLMGNIQLIGYILTAKSIARLTKLKEDKFAEYFLIGNSLSFIIAIAGGNLIKLLIEG